MSLAGAAFHLLLAITLILPNLPVTGHSQGSGDPRIINARGRKAVVNEGRTLQLKAVSASGQDLAGSRWKSDNPAVATINSNGVVTGVAYGYATITARTSAGTAKGSVTVARLSAAIGSRLQGDLEPDASGRIRYLSSPGSHIVLRLEDGRSPGLLAGVPNSPGYVESVGGGAKFNAPTGLALDLGSRGGLYVADADNHVVRKVGLQNQKTELAIGTPGLAGTLVASPSPVAGAVFRRPQGVASVGRNLYVADTENHAIWYVDFGTGKAWLVAGEPGVAGLQDGTGRNARLSSPKGIAIDSEGRTMAVADSSNDAVRIIQLTEGTEPGSRIGAVSTLGGASTKADGVEFAAPQSVSFDGVGNVYVVDSLGASLVTRSGAGVLEQLDVAQEGSFVNPASLALRGSEVLVLDEGASGDELAIAKVEVGPPTISNVTPSSGLLAGGELVEVEGSNFADETRVLVGDGEVTGLEIVNSRLLRFVAPPQGVPGVRTLSVRTRGGVDQAAFAVDAASVSDLTTGEITTYAGGLRYVGDGGSATDENAVFAPWATAIDRDGNLFVADSYVNRVRRIDAQTGVVTTVAGTGEPGYNGDGIAAELASLNNPYGVALDAAGNLFIADSHNSRVRRVDAATGLISTVAGNGQSEFSGDGGLASSAGLNTPQGIAIDGAGNLFIADTLNHRLRRIDAITKRISTYAGSGTAGFSGDGGPATSARLNLPAAIAVDGTGNVLVADSGNNRIRRINVGVVITTFAGNGAGGFNGDGRAATQSSIDEPLGVAVDGAGAVFVADSGNARVRRVAVDGTMTTVAGTGQFDYNGDGRQATTANLDYPAGVTVDSAGNLYVADNFAYRVRKVDMGTGQIATAGGSGSLGPGIDGIDANQAAFAFPTGVDVDGSGAVYVGDEFNAIVRRIDPGTRIVTTIAGSGSYGFSGDDGPARDASLNHPVAVAVDDDGNLFIADRENFRVRRVDADSGTITTLAGSGEYGSGGDEGSATEASLGRVTGVAVGSDGSVYIADPEHNRVRRVDPDGTIHAFAGTGDGGDEGDGGPAVDALLNYPVGVDVDADGRVVIADTLNNKIRVVENGVIDTIAGSGEYGYDGDLKPATEAGLSHPVDIAIDSAGNVFIVDGEVNRIRRVDSDGGNIHTIAGSGNNGYSGDGGPATAARLDYPWGVAVSAAGLVFIADSGNDAIRVVTGVAEGGAGPVISSATYEKPLLVIEGSNFGTSGATVTINGTDVSSRIRVHEDDRLELRGGPKKLKIVTGDNVIVVTVGGVASNAFVLRR